jgi:hypothetical protein
MSEHFDNYMIHELTIEAPDDQGDQIFYGILEEDVLPITSNLLNPSNSKNIFPDLQPPTIPEYKNPIRRSISPVESLPVESTPVALRESSSLTSPSVPTTTIQQLEKTLNSGAYKSNLSKLTNRSKRVTRKKTSST